jgi:exodeoxyribonuclease VII large subunit
MDLFRSQQDLFPVRKVYTVSEITAQIKNRLEAEFVDVTIEGEISNFTAAASGHLYFILKDKGAQIKCVFFRSKARLLRFKVEDGMHVIIRGNLGVYETRGEYQFYVDLLEPKGIGSLQLEFEQLKAKLQAEGLFDPHHKKSLPLLPHTIGIVTSPSGAAIRDILRILHRRHESARVLIYPVKVQGDGAAAEIAQGIRYLNHVADVDVLIVGRGGGSIEDLWAFNEEAVARAIFSSRIPVISAVGHEIDFTIADFVADLRAPTPSGAAELVVSRKVELAERVSNQRRRLVQNLHFQLSQFKNRVLALSTHRVFATVEGKLRTYRQRSDEFEFRLEHIVKGRLATQRNRCQLLSNSLSKLDLTQVVRIKRDALDYLWNRTERQIHFVLHKSKERLKGLEGTLRVLSPMAVLDRGYSICRDSQGNILREARSLVHGDGFTVTLAKGQVHGRVEAVEPGE